MRGVKHKYTFSLRPKLSKMKDEVDKAYDNVRNNIINKNYKVKHIVQDRTDKFSRILCQVIK